MELFKILGTIAVDNEKANQAIDDTAAKADKSSGKTSESFKKIGKAAGTVAKGREYQHLFAARLLSGLSEDDIAAFRRTLSHIDANIDGIRKSGI